ncbi:MAG: class I SAM-dependent methyltransferase [Blautia sp.]|nr:class I SAM-dependent methyltransferase [Blautia sp.]
MIEKPPALEQTPDGLTLTDGRLSLRGDFREMARRLSRQNLAKELLVRAAGGRSFRPGEPGQHPLVIDATAGMGEDSFILAAAGFTVRMYEYDPVIAALLMDALERARLDPELSTVAARMTLYREDSIKALRELPERPDVVFLDPMFPERQKSGLVKKKFQLLQQLERPCADEEDLLNAALVATPGRIVIKRPLKGPYLAGRKPDYSLMGKAIRYDCIVL